MSSLVRGRQPGLAGCWVIAFVLAGSAADAQEQSLKGAAALAHPAVQQALKAIDLIKAGRVDEAMALRTKSEQSDWKSLSPADRKELGAGIAGRTPTAQVFADAVRRSGELTLNGNSGVLAFLVGADRGAAYFEREAGTWRVANGPMVFAVPPDPVNEVRVENAEILAHPIGALAVKYLDLVHAGRMDDAMRLATTAAQAAWKTEPASEKAASLAYRRKNLPTSAAMTAGLKTGKGMRGVLIIEDDRIATLNLIVSEQRPAGANTTTYTSTTQTMGFEKEGGVWKTR